MKLYIFTLVILWIASIIAIVWVWKDASKKRGRNMGYLWSLIVVALGPIGLLGYLFARNPD